MPKQPNIAAAVSNAVGLSAQPTPPATASKDSRRLIGLKKPTRAGGHYTLMLDRIQPHKGQVRQKGREEVEDLVDSFDELGILQPITVIWMGDEADHWRILLGERRYRAALQAGLDTIPVTFGADDEKVTLKQLAENYARKPTHPVNIIQAISSELDKGRQGIEISRATGIPAPRVSKAKQMLKLPKPTLVAALEIANLSIEKLYSLRELSPENQLKSLDGTYTKAEVKEVIEDAAKATRSDTPPRVTTARGFKHSRKTRNGARVTISLGKDVLPTQQVDKIIEALAEELQLFQDQGKKALEAPNSKPQKELPAAA